MIPTGVLEITMQYLGNLKELPIQIVMWSLPLDIFFQGILMGDFFGNLCTARKRAIRKREPTMTPVTISRAKIQVGLEAD